MDTCHGPSLQAMGHMSAIVRSSAPPLLRSARRRPFQWTFGARQRFAKLQAQGPRAPGPQSVLLPIPALHRGGCVTGPRDPRECQPSPLGLGPRGRVGPGLLFSAGTIRKIRWKLQGGVLKLLIVSWCCRLVASSRSWLLAHPGPRGRLGSELGFVRLGTLTSLTFRTLTARYMPAIAQSLPTQQMMGSMGGPTGAYDPGMPSGFSSPGAPRMGGPFRVFASLTFDQVISAFSRPGSLHGSPSASDGRMLEDVGLQIRDWLLHEGSWI